MAPVEVATAKRAGGVREKIAFVALLGALVAYTLTTLDGGDVAPRVISSFVLLLSALFVGVPMRQRLTVNVPIICLLLMACYGAAQTLWCPQKITYAGSAGVIFWFTAAGICFVSSQVFRNREMAERFRMSFVLFGSAVCLLDLLEQASHTNKYFWLIQSRYATVNGPFAYWNNLAQFVELCLPVTLWFAVVNRKRTVAFLILSGLQIGAVVASGSRAGSALALTELLAVMAITYFRKRERAYFYVAASALLVVALFTYAAGFRGLRHKLQRSDQLGVRRDLNASSLAMIRERPLTGWGLGTYTAIYPSFARQDDGSYVNHAHNDWLEWTAEGGFLFSGLMAVVFIWSIRPAIRCVWGIGVIALCLHAAVDYPFARFGVCGCYFALLGMLPAAHKDCNQERGELGTELMGVSRDRRPLVSVS